MHLFGNVAPVAEIEALGVPVLEDAAQAAGSTSAAGRPGALGTRGDVLLLPVEEPRLLRRRRHDHHLRRGARRARARILRFHGSHDKVNYEHLGYNSRLDELQAAILRVQLPHLDELGGRTPRGRAPLRGGRARRAGRAAARRSRAPRPPGTCTSSPPATSSALERALTAAGHRPQGLLPHPRAPAAADARVGRRGGAARHRAGCPHAPGDPDEPGAQRASRRDEVVAAARTRAASSPRALSASALAGPRRAPRARRAREHP